MIATPEKISRGVHDDLSAEAYHGVRAVSATALKLLARKTPRHVKALLDGALSEETSAMSRGTAVHAALLEPGRFEQAYRVGPEANRNSREWKAFAAECEADGVEGLKPSESGEILGMREAVWADPSVRKLLLASDRRELSVFWTMRVGDQELPCKARLDLYSTRYGCILDVKTCGDAELDRFEANSYRLGYHIQLAWYARAAAAVGLSAHMTGILAVECKPPFVPCIFQPDIELLEAGEDAITGLLQRWARCDKTNDWPGWMTAGQPVKIGMPRWAGKVDNEKETSFDD